MRLTITIALIFLLVYSCKKANSVHGEDIDRPISLELPDHFPPVIFPEDNALTEKRIELGRRLFYDTRLSRDNSLSCASCHLQEASFTDQLNVSEGIEGRLSHRNAPTLGNVAYQSRLFVEGGVPNLEIQVLSPIGDPNEFDHDVNIIEADLKADPLLNSLSQTAYNRNIDMYVVTRAIASFERTMITGNSKYDHFLLGQAQLTSHEELGRSLFFGSELNCSTCHDGHNFTDGNYHNIGLYEEYEDEGRFRITNDESDKGKMKTPSLRNVELTAPYMHNGSIETLDQVLEHFISGGENHTNKSHLVVPLNLSAAEKSALLAFLKTLTDYEFINNPKFQPLN
ncbi:MAG: cytochrome-c peroxidase [Flavobacteriales bacterium]